MSGRAGRRGKDDRGIVIQMLDESMEPDVAKGMLYGDPDALYSSYHLGYNMVLNMLRVEDADPENILRASFHQYQVCRCVQCNCQPSVYYIMDMLSTLLSYLCISVVSSFSARATIS